MTPIDVKNYYKSQYMFSKTTGMSSGTLGNWLKWGYVPLLSQIKLEKLTHGVLKSNWEERIK